MVYNARTWNNFEAYNEKQGLSKHGSVKHTDKQTKCNYILSQG
jgi:hypothetical protein